ncbi:MAG TPA: alpha/beta fold hydrolase [Nannocystaceae bacterium]|nr:alpha/beta fold hydrolase [Nannocystaceae bacterium]
MYAEKSTIGRSETLAKPSDAPGGTGILRAGVQLLAAFSPSLATRVITRVWFTPPRARIDDTTRARLDEGRRVPLTIEGRPFAAWSFGEGPRVLLVHGWGGHGGQLIDFVAPLVAQGFEVVTFDGPGHGASSPSTLGYRQGSFVEVASAIRVLADALGPFHAIVAHSGGAIATGIALANGVRTRKLVLVAPMTRPLRYAERFNGWLGLDESQSRAWLSRASDRARFAWADLDLTTAARRFPLPPVLLVHDRGDKEVPHDESIAVALAWPDATLVDTEGLGHRRILHDPIVIDRVSNFVGQR